ncbi:hypothetical protein FRX31_006580 [Thalictrum thalictroides]|uniref:Uncharacterized protein n=1 Tax=Thalictrum thalictroides TaxID=46969 RepID=A0A7J6X636_THATH|nr:hypothetical protein FRX31_006580 [Thalictrum thalictroides]
MDFPSPLIILVPEYPLSYTYQGKVTTPAWVLNTTSSKPRHYFVTVPPIICEKDSLLVKDSVLVENDEDSSSFDLQMALMVFTFPLI